VSDRVLVDTSAWTRFFRKKPDNHATADEVERLLTEGLACFTPPVYLELLVGARRNEGMDELERDFSVLPVLEVGAVEWNKAFQVAAALRKKGLRVDTVDLLVAAAAITNDVWLFHYDNHFRLISRVAPLRERSFLP
jgi:tRNA(fMet)-specific endonuclease VapC